MGVSAYSAVCMYRVDGVLCLQENRVNIKRVTESNIKRLLFSLQFFCVQTGHSQCVCDFSVITALYYIWYYLLIIYGDNEFKGTLIPTQSYNKLLYIYWQWGQYHYCMTGYSTTSTATHVDVLVTHV